MAEKMERTFIAIKPDGVNRGFIGEIITRFEKRGFKFRNFKHSSNLWDKNRQK